MGKTSRERAVILTVLTRLGIVIACNLGSSAMAGDTYPSAQSAQASAQSHPAKDVEGAIHAASPPLDQSKATIKLATFEYAPLMTDVNGVATGPVIDIVREAFRRTGRSIAIYLYPWSRGVGLMESGDMDGFFTIKKNAARELLMYFTRHPLVRQDYVFFIRKDSDIHFRGDFASLAHAKIGVVNGTSYGAEFDQAVAAGRFGSLDAASSYQLTFRKLLAGHVDAVICSRLIGFNILEKLNARDAIVVSGPPASIAYSYLAFSKTTLSTKVADEFDRALESMQADGATDRILNAYGVISLAPD